MILNRIKNKQISCLISYKIEAMQSGVLGRGRVFLVIDSPDVSSMTKNEVDHLMGCVSAMWRN